MRIKQMIVFNRRNASAPSLAGCYTLREDGMKGWTCRWVWERSVSASCRCSLMMKISKAKFVGSRAALLRKGRAALVVSENQES